MSVTEKLFDGVALKPQYDGLAERSDYNDALGFMETDFGPLRETGRVTLLGFGVSGWQQGTADVADSFEPITSQFRLAGEMLTLDRQGKGIGARMYNTAQALAATAEQPSEVGLYAFAVDLAALWDKRRSIDHTLAGKLLRIGQHGWLKLAALGLGTERVIQVVDSKQGEAEAVLYNQTPRGERQKDQNHSQPSVVTEELMIVCRKQAKLTKVGQYTSER